MDEIETNVVRHLGTQKTEDRTGGGFLGRGRRAGGLPLSRLMQIVNLGDEQIQLLIEEIRWRDQKIAHLQSEAGIGG